VARAEIYLRAKFHLDPSNRLATIHQRHRQTGQDRQRSDIIGRTVLQTVAQTPCGLCACACVCIAYGCRSGRRRPVAGQSRLVPGRLPRGAVYRVQRRARLVPLLRQQVQLLADDDRRPPAVPASAAGHAQGRQPAVAHRPLPGLHEAAAGRHLGLMIVTAADTPPPTTTRVSAAPLFVV